MNMNEKEWDKKLRIDTIGRVDTHADEYYYPYEPTPYSVLQRLAESDFVSKETVLVDYGCGKGRVGFYLNYVLGCQTIGVECEVGVYWQAKENQSTYIKAAKSGSVGFVLGKAEEFLISEANSFYFFNPFSVEILKGVIGRILDSYYDNPREMTLFFYYPNDEYVSYLMTINELNFLDEIDCRDLFDGNNGRERILIFEIEGSYYDI
jgi:hypothetical protein